MNRLAPLVLAGLFAIPATAQTQAGNAVDVDPDVHAVVLDNEFIRVFDARASRGTRSPMHTHAPMVLVSIGKTRFRLTQADGKTGIFDLNPGQVLWVPGAQHSWELIAGELHAIGVEVKSAQKASEPPAPQRKPNDAVAVDPAVHRVLLENPHVRVYEGRGSHGGRSPMHSHSPLALVSIDWLRLKFTMPDGKETIFDFSPGQVAWMPEGAEHSWEAVAGSGRVIVIEVKAAAVAAGATN